MDKTNKIWENIYDLNINDAIEYFLGLTSREDKMAFIHALSWNMEESLFLSEEARMRCEFLILYLSYLVYKNDIQMAKVEKGASKNSIVDFSTKKYEKEAEKGIRAVELCDALYSEWYGKPYIDLSEKYLKLKR